MLPYPHEDLPELRMSLRDFYKEARRICHSDDHPAKESFVNFVLAGRHHDGQTERRVTIDVEKDTDDFESIPNLTVSRDYDSMIGISHNLPYNVAMPIFPLPNFRDSLQRTNHLTKKIHRTAERDSRTISLHLIPHYCIAKHSARMKCLIFFPKLYEPHGTAQMSQEDLATIYDHCVRPTVAEILPSHLAHWPLNYKACQMTSRDKHSKFHFSSFEVPPDLLAEFAGQLRDRLHAYERFQDSFFLHEFRGLKGGTSHDPDDDDKADEYLNQIVEPLDLAQLGDPPDLSSWWLDIAIEVSAPDRVIQWREDAHGEIVQYMLPSISFSEVWKVLKSKSYHPDVSTLLYDLAGFRAEVPHAGKKDNICYLNVYTTDKSPTYQLHPGSFRRHRASDLLPDKLDRLLMDVENLGLLYQLCAGRGTSGKLQEGAARAEVRARMIPGVIPATLRYMEMEMIQSTMVAYPAKDWWRFKYWRLAALGIVFQSLARSPPEMRSLDRSLRLGAVAVWIKNSLIYRPGEQRWDEPIIESSTAYETGDRFRNVAVMEDGQPVVQIVEGDGQQGVEGDEEVWMNAEEMRELIETGDAVPMIECRGCYFLSAVDSVEGTLLCPADGEIAFEVYATVYNQPSFAALRVSFLQAHIKKQRKEAPATRRNRARPVVQPARTSPERDIDFGLAVAGVRLRRAQVLAGRDIIAAMDAGHPDPGHNPAVDERVNDIWRQFFRDIVRITPSMKHGGSYCTLSQEEIETRTDADYTNTTLPFTRVIVKAAPRETWDVLFFDRFFPPKAKCVSTSTAKSRQHYHNCGWWLMWNLLAGDVDARGLELIRQRLRVHFGKLKWMPWSQADRVWKAGAATSGTVLRLPDDSSVPALHIAVNESSGTSIYDMKLKT